MKFQTKLILGGKTATGMVVPDKIVEALGSGKKPAVTVTINGYSYRSTVAVMGGKFMLPVAAEVRVGAGIAAGDQLDVNVELDTVPREVVVPEDFAKALTGDAKAKKFFDGLSYSNKRGFVMSIEGAKAAETRQRRIDRAVVSLSEGKVQ
jgi:hypothetical protein